MAPAEKQKEVGDFEKLAASMRQAGRRFGLSAGCFILAFAFEPTASAQTAKLLDSPVVKSELQVRWNETTKSMEWAADGKQPYRSIQTDSIFLTKRSIYVTYYRMNPLRVQATATTTAADDPSYAVITKLIDAITSVATTVRPATPSVANLALLPATPCSDPQGDFDNLFNTIYGKENSGKFDSPVKAWIGAIDTAFAAGRTGPDAIAAGSDVIRKSAARYEDAVKEGSEQWANIRKCANRSGPNAALYAAVSLIDINNRIAEIAAAGKGAKQLADLLDKQYGAAEKWLGQQSQDYAISGEIIPTYDKMQNVIVKVVNVTVKVDPNTIALTTEQQAAGSASFSVRKFSVFAPEIGVGAVFGSIKQPKYGTGTNAAGQTIVTRVQDTSISVNPTILANFVCRCGMGLLSPMLQIGASTSKDLPAILVGGGLRLFGLGKGDVAIGGGAMFAWYKDLQKLKVGDVVTGTTQIDADLGYTSRPKLGAYFAIQYKF